jgi:Zn-dependent protease
MEFNFAEAVQRIAAFMPSFLLALVVHEFAHAWMATRFGDKTSEWSGRLTLNPIAHMDPFGTVVFPLMSILLGSPIFFGWAKPVPINPNQFSNYRKGLFWVSFAGPLSNILLGFLTAFAYVAFFAYMPKDSGYYEAGTMMLQSLIVLNFSLAIFNLIPIPPLDGSNIVLSFLDYNASRKFMAIQQYSFMILLFLMFSGAFNLLRFPIVFLAESSIFVASLVFGFASPA